MTELKATYIFAQLEADIQNDIIDLLKRSGFMVIRVNSGRSSPKIAFVRWFCEVLTKLFSLSR